MTYDLNANIIINGNSIDHGVFNNGSGNTTYTYANNAWIYGSSLITSNSFYNPTAFSDMLNITDGSCIIRDNRFFRNGTLINSYIKHHFSDGYSHSGIDQITDNIFDSTDIGDGYTTELVKSLNRGSVYTRNKNQTNKLYLSLFDSLYGFTNSPSLDYTSLTDIEIEDKSGGLGITANKRGHNLITRFTTGDTSSSDILNIVRTFSLSSLLEKGMNITNVRLGAYLSSGTVSDFSNPFFFGLNLKSHDAINSMDATTFATTTYLGIKTFEYDIADSTKLTALQSSTQYTIPSSSVTGGFLDGDYYGFIQADAYRVGNGYDIELEFRSYITFTDDSWSMYFTPIEITYTW